jgi:hypothetical protein
MQQQTGHVCVVDRGSGLQEDVFAFCGNALS